MYCTDPNYINGMFTPCRKCKACQVAKKKEWADRLVIESTFWPFSYFVSMTYDPEHMPEDLSLRPKDMVDWKKRLGYYFGRVPQLYYCGEYGDAGDLPHYHAIIFCGSDRFHDILKSWDLGRISIEYCTPERCAYTTGYTTEKIDKPERTDGRHPEFYGASRKPPLGYQLLFNILERMATDDGFRERILRHPYPPYSVSVGGKNIRLPPYIRNKLSPIWREFNAEVQKNFVEQKKEESEFILNQIKKNLQNLSLLEDDSDIIFVDKTGLEKTIRYTPRLNWKHFKFVSCEIRTNLEARNRKAYNLRHRRA